MCDESSLTYTTLFHHPQAQSDHLEPTVGYSVEKFTKGKVNFTVFDMGGAKNFRTLWAYYYQSVQGVIFVIDTSDKIRMVCVKDELKLLLQHKGMCTHTHVFVL